MIKYTFCVYAIQSQACDRIYIGQTQSINERLIQHNKGRVRSTSHDCPWHLLALEYFDTREKARWCEHQLKKSHGRRDKWLTHYKISNKNKSIQ